MVYNLSSKSSQQIYQRVILLFRMDHQRLEKKTSVIISLLKQDNLSLQFNKILYLFKKNQFLFLINDAITRYQLPFVI